LIHWLFEAFPVSLRENVIAIARGRINRRFVTQNHGATPQHYMLEFDAFSLKNRSLS